MNDGDTTLQFEILQDNSDVIQKIFFPDEDAVKETKRVQGIVMNHVKCELKHLCPNATKKELKNLEKFAFLFACHGWNLHVEYEKGVM